MARLNLIIADPDEFYTDGIVKFLASNYSNRFRVNAFSKRQGLFEFLSQPDKKVDILLIHTEFFSESIPLQNTECVLLLSDGLLSSPALKYDLIKKYQHGDQLVRELLSGYAKSNQHRVVVAPSENKSKVVGIYSPIGGSGKTTLAIGLSLQCIHRGLSVFYLNLESVPSTALYFKTTTDVNFSNLILSMKEGTKNLSLQIESIRRIDAPTKLHYFAPPDSVLEYEECSLEECTELIHQLQTLGQYDVIVVDLSSELHSKNMALMPLCDALAVVTTQAPIAPIKLKAFSKELEIASMKGNNAWIDQLLLVLNQYDPAASFFNINQLQLRNKGVAVMLPFSAEVSANPLNCLSDPNHPLPMGIDQILSRFWDE